MGWSMAQSAAPCSLGSTTCSHSGALARSNPRSKLPEYLGDLVTEANLVRVIEALVAAFDLRRIGCADVEPCTAPAGNCSVAAMG